jgi:hypothetical protein
MQAHADRQRIKEGKHAINWTRLSCKGKAQNEVRLLLQALAYNLGVFLQGTDVRLVADQPANPTDKDWCPSRSTRPGHHVPTR